MQILAYIFCFYFRPHLIIINCTVFLSSSLNSFENIQNTHKNWNDGI